MNRKIIAAILTGIITVLLITGCSSKTEDKDVSGAGTTQAEKKEEKKEENPVILPADAQIGIFREIWSQREYLRAVLRERKALPRNWLITRGR